MNVIFRSDIHHIVQDSNRKIFIILNIYTHEAYTRNQYETACLDNDKFNYKLTLIS